MRPIKNSIIKLAENSGFSEVSDYFDDLLKKKEAQYNAMQQYSEKHEKENILLHAFINTRNLGAEYVVFVEAQEPDQAIKDVIEASK